ncbi:MAG: hypothetical protein LBS53_01875 [Synergistaceae bacterium]|jgi:hypothetical protein|nr:hypothetical protein [Synergistaceae bacterium]
MKRIFAVLSLCVMLLTVPASANTGAELPRILEDIVRNRDFFGSPWALWGYEDCVLLDVKRLDEKRVGVDLIAPSCLEYVAVYDVKTLRIIYSDAFVPEKSRRNVMRRIGISVRDAMKVAKSAIDAEMLNASK